MKRLLFPSLRYKIGLTSRLKKTRLPFECRTDEQTNMKKTVLLFLFTLSAELIVSGES